MARYKRNQSIFSLVVRIKFLHKLLIIFLASKIFGNTHKKWGSSSTSSRRVIINERFTIMHNSFQMEEFVHCLYDKINKSSDLFVCWVSN